MLKAQFGSSLLTCKSRGLEDRPTEGSLSFGATELAL